MLIKGNSITTLDFNAAAKESLDLTHYSDIDFENVSPNGKDNTVLTPC